MNKTGNVFSIFKLPPVPNDMEIKKNEKTIIMKSELCSSYDR